MGDAVAELVRDGDTVAIEGFTHLICFAAGHEIIRQRKRDLTLARLTPDVIYDQMIAGGVARKLVFSWLGNPGVGGLNAIRRRIEAVAAAARDRGVQPLRDGRPVHRRRREPAVLPAPLVLRDRPAEGEPADPADRVAVRRRHRLRGPAAPAGRDDRPRPARVGRRRHPGLGPARLPEGGGVRGRAGDRRRRGGRRRCGHPGRPEPDDHPGPDRRRGRGRAVGRPSLVRPGRLRPRQPLLPRLGSDLARRGGDPGLARRMGPRRAGRGGVPREARRGAGRRRSGRRRRRRPARSTTASTADGRADDPRRRALPLGHGRRPGADPGERRRDDADGARALSPRPPAGDGRVVRAAAHRGGRGRRAGRRRRRDLPPDRRAGPRALRRLPPDRRPVRRRRPDGRVARELGKQVFTDMEELP